MTAVTFLGFSLPICLFYKHVPVVRRLQNYRIAKYLGLAALLILPSNVVSSVYQLKFHGHINNLYFDNQEIYTKYKQYGDLAVYNPNITMVYF